MKEMHKSEAGWLIGGHMSMEHFYDIQSILVHHFTTLSVLKLQDMMNSASVFHLLFKESSDYLHSIQLKCEFKRYINLLLLFGSEGFLT